MLLFMKNFFTSRIASLGHAIKGIISFIKTERNSWIHSMATIAVITAGFVRNIDKYGWCCLVIAMALVWITEAINTAIEKLCDKVTPEQNVIIKLVKDISAGAVLLASITAVIIGVIVFL